MTTETSQTPGIPPGDTTPGVPVTTTPSSRTTSSTVSQTDTSSTTTTTKSSSSSSSSSTKTTTSTSTSVTSPSHATGSDSPASATPSATITSGDSGLSSGAVAGIGIGCAAAGAIIAALLAFFIMYRKNRRSQPPEPRYQPTTAGSGKVLSSDSEQGADAADSPTVAGPVGAVEELLPQPSETKYLAGELSKLQMLIRNHVSNFYSDQYIDSARLEGMINPEALNEVAAGTSFTSDMWLSLLGNPATRRTAIHYVLSWTVLNRIQPSGVDMSRTLLPLTVVGCLQAMNGPSTKTKESEYLKSKWRATTAILQRDKYAKNPFAEGDDRNKNLESVLAILNEVLRPLTELGNEAARTSNLEQIVKYAASFGLTLVSEPSSWSFNWHAPQKSVPNSALVIFPTLVQRADENGHPTQRPLEIGEREIAHNISVP